MQKSSFFSIFFCALISFAANAAIQPSMYFRANWANKTSMTLVALPDNTNTWVISFPQSTIGSGTNQWFKMEVTGNYTTNQTWGYGKAPVFNTSTNIPVNGANGLITAVSGKTYVFTIKDVANSTASTGFVFELGGSPVSVSSTAIGATTPATPVTVNATLSGSLVTNQTVWLRYAVGSSTFAGSSIVQMSGSGTSYTATIPGQSVGATVYYYCFTSGTVAGGGGVTTSNVTQATINKTATANYTVATAQVLSVSPATLSGFSYFPGAGPSAIQTYVLSGQYLTGYPDVVQVSAPINYEISSDDGSSWGTSCSVPFTSASMGPQTISVRLKAGLPQGNYNNESVTHSGGGASVISVSCNGTVLKDVPAGQASNLVLSAGSPASTTIHFTWNDNTTDTPVPDGYLIRGSSIGYEGISDPVNGITVASGGLDKNVLQGVQSADITGLSQGTMYYFKVYSFTNSGNNILYNQISPAQNFGSTSVTTFYSKAAGYLNDIASWGSNADGSGNPPPNFTSDGMTYIVKNNPSPTTNNPWTISGASSKLQIGDGTTAVNFSSLAAIGLVKLDVLNNAVVTLGAVLTSTDSVIVKSGGTLNCGSFILAGTGVFNLNSGGTLGIGSSLGITTSGANGNIQTTGARIYSQSGKYVYSGTTAQVTGNGFSQSLASGGLLRISNTAGTVSLSQYMRANSGSVCTVDEGAIFSTGASNYPQFDAGCAVTVNGTFQIEQGAGCVGGANFVYGPNGTFSANSTSSQISIYNNNPFWNNNTGYVATPPNVNIKGAGGLNIQTGCTLTVSGTFQTSGPVTISSPAVLVINGTGKINTGGSFNNSPTFGSSSNLIYNQGGTRSRGNEWTSNTSGTGYPANVQISNATTLGMSTVAAQCGGNLSVDAGCTLNTTSNIITIKGNIFNNGTLSLGGDMKCSGNWGQTGAFNSNSHTVSLTGAAQQNISGAPAFYNLTINNPSGIQLESNISVSNQLLMQAGILNQNGNLLQVTSGASIQFGGGSITPAITLPAAMNNFTPPGGASVGSAEITGNLTIANGMLTVTSGDTLSLGSTGLLTGEANGNYVTGSVSANRILDAAAVNIGGLGISIDPNGSTLGNSTIIREAGPACLVTNAGHSSINRKWTIIPTNQPASDVTVSFTWLADDDHGANLSEMYVWKSDDGLTWSVIAGPIDCSAHTVTFTTSSFSQFTLADAENSLPVELGIFSAHQLDQKVTLHWTTFTEVNSSKFEIQYRPMHTSEWQTCGAVQAHGNSNAPLDYSFSVAVEQAGEYEYRLKMIDNDGSHTYSIVALVNFKAPLSFRLDQNYPNPFNPATLISYQVPTASHVTISIFTPDGRLLANLVDEHKEAGYYTSIFHAEGYASGIYLCRMKCGRFTEMKKMILMK